MKRRQHVGKKRARVRNRRAESRNSKTASRREMCEGCGVYRAGEPHACMNLPARR